MIIWQRVVTSTELRNFGVTPAALCWNIGRTRRLRAGGGWRRFRDDVWSCSSGRRVLTGFGTVEFHASNAQKNALRRFSHRETLQRADQLLLWDLGLLFDFLKAKFIYFEISK